MDMFTGAEIAQAGSTDRHTLVSAVSS